VQLTVSLLLCVLLVVAKTGVVVINFSILGYDLALICVCKLPGSPLLISLVLCLIPIDGYK
jgi:hypothetical protein